MRQFSDGLAQELKLIAELYFLVTRSMDIYNRIHVPVFSSFPWDQSQDNGIITK